MGIAAFSAIVLKLLLVLKVNIFKPIVLIGTFALAMAFAANDLVNFIGVPMAGFHAYEAAVESGDMANASMGALGGKVPASTLILVLAGLVMALTLWFSRKARTVISTGVDLGQQYEGVEHFGASNLSRAIVHGTLNFFAAVRRLTPTSMRAMVARQFDATQHQAHTDDEHRPSFDLLRAAVSIMVASALISYGTAHKLPLSTTYVTFMVAMGASFADQAWGRESAVFRVAGVLTVVGGWLLTALGAFAVSALIATVIFYGKGFAVALLMIVAGVIIWKNHSSHARRSDLAERGKVFNLRKVTDVSETVSITFAHTAELLKTMTQSLDLGIEGLFKGNVNALRKEQNKAREVRQWSNIIIANAFKSLRLLQKENTIEVRERNYLQVVRRLQKLSDGYFEVISRSYEHVANNHSPLLKAQIEDLGRLKRHCLNVLNEVVDRIESDVLGDLEKVYTDVEALKKLSLELQHRQLDRIQSGEAKTRLSILFFAFTGDFVMLANQAHQLLHILDDSFKGVETHIDIYTE